MKIFEDIYIYINRPLAERQSHLDLDESCIELGGRCSTEYRALLAYELRTTIPKGMNKVYLCHACNNSSCCNPRHLYWGTPRENVLDMTKLPSWKKALLEGQKVRDKKKKNSRKSDREAKGAPLERDAV